MLSTDIQFSDEQAMLLDSAVAFCRKQSPTLTVRRHLLSDTGYNGPVCIDQSNGCVPINFFGQGNFTPAMYQFIALAGAATGV